MNIIKRLGRLPSTIFQKMKVNKSFRYKVYTTVFITGSINYYFNHMYYRKLKGLNKLSSLYRPEESE